MIAICSTALQYGLQNLIQRIPVLRSTALQCGATRFFERTESLYSRSTLRPKGFNPRSRFSVAPHCNAVLRNLLNESDSLYCRGTLRPKEFNPTNPGSLQHRIAMRCYKIF